MTLSNPSGAYIEDGTAIGPINNCDPMPRAWMVRFGRTVGSQVVDALGQRLDDVAMDGDMTTGLIGFDAEWERALAGVMLSQSTGEGDYRLSAENGGKAGTVESSLTGIYPYARLALSTRISAWVPAGTGNGELTLRQEGDKAMPTDITMRMGAVGFNGQVLDGTAPCAVVSRTEPTGDALCRIVQNRKTQGSDSGQENFPRFDATRCVSAELMPVAQVAGSTPAGAPAPGLRAPRAAQPRKRRHAADKAPSRRPMPRLNASRTPGSCACWCARAQRTPVGRAPGR